MLSILKHPAFWGVVATVGVVGFAYCLGVAEIAEGQTRFDAFMQAPANEVGDTLAGFAGALAFVWIIVTVWLQALELKAQREELGLTRGEIEEQRKATQDMAHSMSVQAKIFEDEKVFREMTGAGEQFDELIGCIREFSFDHYIQWEFEPYSPTATGENPRLEFYWPYASTLRNFFLELEDHLRRLDESLNVELSKGTLVNPWDRHTYWPQEPYALLGEACELYPKLSPAKKRIFELYKIRESKEAMDILKDGPWWVE